MEEEEEEQKNIWDDGEEPTPKQQQQPLPAPSTPMGGGSKREAAPMIPPKTLRSADPEPSNGELLELAKAMFDKQESATWDFSETRVQRADVAVQRVDTGPSGLTCRSKWTAWSCSGRGAQCSAPRPASDWFASIGNTRGTRSA